MFQPALQLCLQCRLRLPPEGWVPITSAKTIFFMGTNSTTSAPVGIQLSAAKGSEQLPRRKSTPLTPLWFSPPQSAMTQMRKSTGSSRRPLKGLCCPSVGSGPRRHEAPPPSHCKQPQRLGRTASAMEDKLASSLACFRSWRLPHPVRLQSWCLLQLARPRS